MKLGAEPKKIGIFVALLLVAGMVYWMNSSPASAPSPAAARSVADGVTPVATAAVEGTGTVVKKRVATGRASIAENIYKLPQAVDPAKVDPTLRLELLAKVQAVEPEGGSRNLFQFSTEPLPQPAAIKGPIPNVPNLHPNGPQPLPPNMASVQRPTPPGPPPVPPINLKYYGYSSKRSDGEKKAFFLDGEDIIVAAEGEIIKKQYKVVRIGVNSVQMEDTTSKTTQTLPIQPDIAPV